MYKLNIFPVVNKGWRLYMAKIPEQPTTAKKLERQYNISLIRGAVIGAATITALIFLIFSVSSILPWRGFTWFTLIILLVIFVLILVLIAFLYKGYTSWQWTGFGEYTSLPRP